MRESAMQRIDWFAALVIQPGLSVIAHSGGSVRGSGHSFFGQLASITRLDANITVSSSNRCAYLGYSMFDDDQNEIDFALQQKL